MSKIVLPGSTGDEEDRIGRGGSLSAEDAVILAQVAHWWRHRLASNDAANPLESLIGGVDLRGTATTTGIATATVNWPAGLTIPAGGASFLLHAFGRPSAPASEVYSLLALAHFYNDPTNGWLTRYTTIARAPTSPDTTELRATTTGSPATPAIQIAGVAGQTITWHVDVYRLEMR